MKLHGALKIRSKIDLLKKIEEFLDFLIKIIIITYEFKN